MTLPDPRRLRIVVYPHPALRKKAKPVERCSPALAEIAGRMLELMREAKGVGLAAPQVGLSLRLFVCNPTGEPGDDLLCVNPTLMDLSGGEERTEGCLSIPEVTVTMRRATHAVLHATGLDEKAFTIVGDDLRARIWQHEVDHLDGRLIIDNMSELDEIANRKAIKQLDDQFRRSRKR